MPVKFFVRCGRVFLTEAGVSREKFNDKLRGTKKDNPTTPVPAKQHTPFNKLNDKPEPATR